MSISVDVAVARLSRHIHLESHCHLDEEQNKRTTEEENKTVGTKKEKQKVTRLDLI